MGIPSGIDVMIQMHNLMVEARDMIILIRFNFSNDLFEFFFCFPEIEKYEILVHLGNLEFSSSL